MSNNQSTTLHDLERDSGEDRASQDYWAQCRALIMTDWVQARQPGTVVDIGCGSGYLTARIAAATDATVVGVDHNKQSINVARERATTATFDVSDARDLPYYDGRADVVVFGDVLEHFADPEPLLAEGRRVLAPDGRMIISVPAFRWLLGPHDEHNDHADRYDTERLQATVREADLRLVRSRYTNVLPLVPYFVTQRVLKRPVPDGVRGSHGGLLERVKQRLIDIETRIDPPAGVTLLAEVRP